MNKSILLIFKSVLLLSFIIFMSCDNNPAGSKNTIPVIQSIIVNPPTVNTNGTATVTVTATDAENNALTYTYTPNGGAITGTGPFVNWTAPGTAGAFSVTVKVSDGSLIAEGSGNLNVTAPAVVTQVTGNAYFPAGVNGNLYNSKVSLYTSLNNWINYSHIKFVSATGEGANVNFTIPDVNPGNYYLDVWKDNDNSGAWSTGDFVGWYGSGGLAAPALTEFQIAEGQTVNISVQMFIL